MKRKAAAQPLALVAPKPAQADCRAPLLSEDEAAQVMWVFYRDNKPKLVDGIREYRTFILSQLIEGRPVAEVFAPFARPVEPARVVKRAA